MLKGLQELLQKFNTSNEKKGGQAKKGKGKPTDNATKGKGKTQSAPATGDKLGKGKAGKPQKGSVVSPSKGNLGNVSKGSSGGTSLEPPNTTTSEGALLGALRRLVERSGKNNGEGLLDRLTGLVQAASTGKSLSSKGRKNKNRPKIGGSPPTQAVGAKSKGKGKGLSPSEGPVKGKGSGKDFQLIRLLPSGWPPSAAMSVTKLREALSRGEVPSGCVTWCTEVQIAELRNLAQVHQITKAYALVCLINKGQSEPPIGNASRHLLPATDAASKAGLGQFWACPLASQYPQLPSCSTSSRAPKVERALTTLRVQIPQRLLQADGWRNVVRSPAAVLRTVISPTAFHSTFKWSQVAHRTRFGGEETVLEGFVKVDKQEVFDILRRSGSKGLFLAQTTRDNPNPPKVSWVSRVANETDFQYMARVQQLAFTKQVPLKFRVGGGACLGLLGTDADDEKPKVWQVTGVPAKWTAQDVVRCLEGAGCEDTTVVRRPTKAQPWMILSRVQKEFQNVQVFGVDTHGIYLTLSKPPPKKSITGKKAVAAGFWQHRELPQVACPDVATTRTEVTNAADTAVVARKKHKPETPLPYEVVDCGGAGNCGWNCIATAMMLNKNVPLAEAREQVAAATKTLRADVSTHLHRHAKEYEPLWAVNDQETEDTAGGPIPENFPEWAETVKRDGQWLCGMTLEAITRRCGIRIVVVEERADGSAVPYVFGPNKKREFPVVLYLKDQHFQLVRKRDGHVFPVEWEKSSNTNDASRLHLKGAGKWWADSTPSEKGSEEKKVNRSSTPAASLSSAAGSQLRFWSRGSPSEAPVSTHGSPRVRYWKKTTPDQSFVSGRASLADKHAQEHEDSGSARSVTALPPRPSEVGGQVSDALFGPGPTPEGRIGTIHELTKEEQMSRPWWTCQLCGFHVFQKWIQGKYCNAHYTHRKRHLLKAHGVKKPPPLPKGSMSMPCELPRGSSSIMMCFGKLFGKPITGSDGPAVTESPLKGPELFPKEVLGFGTIDALIVIMSCLEETSLKLVPAPSQATPASFWPKQKGSGSGGSCSSSKKWLRSSREN